MKELLTTISSYLGSKGVTVQALGMMPEKPLVCTCITLTGGPTMPGDPVRRRSFQVLHRTSNQEQGLSLVNTIHFLLSNHWNGLNDSYRGRILAEHEPGLYVIDENKHFVYTCNYMFVGIS